MTLLLWTCPRVNWGPPEGGGPQARALATMPHMWPSRSRHEVPAVPAAGSAAGGATGGRASRRYGCSVVRPASGEPAGARWDALRSPCALWLVVGRAECRDWTAGTSCVGENTVMSASAACGEEGTVRRWVRMRHTFMFGSARPPARCCLPCQSCAWQALGPFAGAPTMNVSSDDRRSKLHPRASIVPRPRKARKRKPRRGSGSAVPEVVKL